MPWSMYPCISLLPVAKLALEVSAVADHHITLYVAPNSEECSEARQYLHESGLQFELKDIGGDPGARGELVHKTGSTRVPAADIDGHVVVGFFKPKWEHLIHADAQRVKRPDDRGRPQTMEGPRGRSDEPR